MLMVISPGWPTMRSGSSNRRQHAPKPSSYDISTLLKCDITTLLLHTCRSHFKMSGRQLNRNVVFSGVHDLFLMGCRSRRVEERILNG
ncbi:hypothetical protein, partial [Burkholderia sp. BCC0405]|uniref:hypothetical protein n=1 Tax=Burkholderia sp. BCC0405 TaxID=2676298 RepID=UPI001ABAD7D0